MMRMTLVLGVVLVWCAAGLAAEPSGEPSMGVLLKERLEVMKQSRALEDEMRRANSALQEKAYGLRSAAMSMKAPPPAAEQLKSLQDEVARLESSLASAKMRLEAAQVKDPAERAARAKELDAQAKEAEEQLRTAERPVREKIEALNKPLAATEKAFVAGLDRCFKDGTAKAAGTTRDQIIWFSGNNTAQIHWKGKDGARMVWVALFLRPELEPVRNGNVDGKYQLSSHSGDFASLVVGHFNIHVRIENKEWQGDEASKIDLVKKLIDLDALAAIKAE